MPGRTKYAAARSNLIRTARRKGWNIKPWKTKENGNGGNHTHIPA